MSFSTAQKVIKLLLSQANIKGKKIVISFFGGEPFLEFDLIRKIVKYCKQEGEKTGVNFVFRTTSNFTLITDEIISFILKHKFRLMVSIDGPPDVHNRNRRFRNGANSFDKVIQNAFKVENYLRDIPIRMTISPDDSERIAESITFLESLQLGFITAAPMIQGDWSEVIEKGILDNEFSKIANSVIEGFRRGRLALILSLNSYLLKYELFLRNGITNNNCQTCQGGITDIAVTSDSRIFPCQQYQGLNDWAIGNCETGIDLNKRQFFLSNHYSNFHYCDNCEVNDLCTGPCMSASLLNNNDIYSPVDVICAFSKGWIKTAKYIHSVLSYEENPLFLEFMQKA